MCGERFGLFLVRNGEPHLKQDRFLFTDLEMDIIASVPGEFVTGRNARLAPCLETV